jgi:holo-[acyl-carrier protein] synthase
MSERVVVGIDVQPIDEVEASLNSFGNRYRHLLFTDNELENCGDNPATASRLAARFAAKEAVLKILNVGESVPSWRSIEVQRTNDGRPEIVLYDEAAALARRGGIRDLSVSLSHAGGIATAAVVATVNLETGKSHQ